MPILIETFKLYSLNYNTPPSKTRCKKVQVNVKKNVNLIIVVMHLALQTLSLASLQACHFNTGNKYFK